MEEKQALEDELGVETTRREQLEGLIDKMQHFQARQPSFRVLAYTARALNAAGSIPGHSVAVGRALKSGLFATAGGKEGL